MSLVIIVKLRDSAA